MDPKFVEHRLFLRNLVYLKILVYVKGGITKNNLGVSLYPKNFGKNLYATKIEVNFFCGFFISILVICLLIIDSDKTLFSVTTFSLPKTHKNGDLYCCKLTVSSPFRDRWFCPVFKIDGSDPFSKSAVPSHFKIGNFNCHSYRRICL